MQAFWPAAHSHGASTAVELNLQLRATTAVANNGSPQGASLANNGRDRTYSTTAPNVDMVPGSVVGTAAATTTIASVGSNQPIATMPPFLVVNCIIALEGIFPARP